MPAATTRPTPATAIGFGTWCSATKPIPRAKAGSSAIRVPKAPAVEPPQREQLQDERDDREQDRQAEPDEQQLGVSRPTTCRPGHQGRDQGGDRHGDRQPGDAGDGVADLLGEQDVGRPAAGRAQRERDTDRVHGAGPRLGQAQHAGRRPARPTARPTPRLRATATPSGPRNSIALAVPSGSRVTAAMNSSVTPAVTTPSATPARSASRLNVGRARPHDDQQDHPRPEQPQPRRARRRRPGRSGPTEAARPSWTQSIDTTAIEAPVRGSRSERGHAAQ